MPPGDRCRERACERAANRRVVATKRREGGARHERRPHRRARAETGRRERSGLRSLDGEAVGKRTEAGCRSDGEAGRAAPLSEHRSDRVVSLSERSWERWATKRLARRRRSDERQRRKRSPFRKMHPSSSDRSSAPTAPPTLHAILHHDSPEPPFASPSHWPCVA
jgi:hypothetical protein